MLSFARVLIAAGLLASTACRPTLKPVSLKAPAKHPDAEAYYDILERWTRYDSIIKDLNTTLKAHATWRSAEYDAAFASKSGELFRLPKRTVAKMETEHAAERSLSHRFVLVIATYDMRWNDLSSKDSHWRLHLVNDQGQSVEPGKITRQRRLSVTDQVFFPHAKMFFVRYDISFPRKLPDQTELISSATKQVTLRFSGALGHAELHWDLR